MSATRGLGFSTYEFTRAWEAHLRAFFETVTIVVTDMDQTGGAEVIRRPNGQKGLWIVIHVLLVWTELPSMRVSYESTPDRVVLMQMEQLARPQWMTDMKAQISTLVRQFGTNHVSVIDFARSNVTLLRPFCNSLSFTRHVAVDPPCVHVPNLTPVAQRTILVGLCGIMNDRRRAYVDAVQAVLPEGSKVETSYGWFANCDAQLQKTRVLINVHFHPTEYGALETVRLMSAISKGCYIISEDTYGQDTYSWFIRQSSAVSLVRDHHTPAQFAQAVVSILKSLDNTYDDATMQNTVQRYATYSTALTSAVAHWLAPV